MAQNIYDNQEFFNAYRTLPRQTDGLSGALEWPSFRSLLPELNGRRVLDLGCGFGWLCRFAVEDAHAASAHGLDLSERMLAGARAMTDNPAITYEVADLDQLTLEPDAADVIISSLALHYVADFDRLCAAAASTLTAGGSFVFSVEHPIYSAPSQQQFVENAGGPVWPLENYLIEGVRQTNWMVDGVVKHHRTVATYVNGLVSTGMTVNRLVEWGPSVEQIDANPVLASDLHRPWFLLVAAQVGSGG